jgi:hypothetical protein
MKTTVTYEVEVPEEDWIGFLTKYNDIFGRNYCGYWLRGVEHDASWLCWEDDEEHRPGDEPQRRKALAAWRAGTALPSGWHRLDRDTAVRAYHEGCKRWGADWFENGDGERYDVVIQLALLGEIKYG